MNNKKNEPDSMDKGINSQEQDSGEKNYIYEPSVDHMEYRMRNLTSEWETNEKPILENFYNMYNARVLKVDDEAYPYRMWFFGESVAQGNPGFPGSDATFHARSSDLKNWEVYAGDGKWDTTMNASLWVPVMTADNKIYDNTHIGDPSVVYKDGKFYMAVSSVGIHGSNNKYFIVNCIMGAISEDGINWTRTSEPILIWDKEHEIRWDVTKPEPPETSYGGYHRPSLIYDEGVWKIWFDYYLPGTFLSMGYAENKGDFMNSKDWKIINCDEEPQLKDWPNPNVIKYKDKYYAFCDAPGFSNFQGPHRRIVMAESDNGRVWRVLGSIVPEPQYGTHLPEAFINEEDGETWLYIFYSWQSGEVFPRYTKINYMRKRLEP